MYSHVIICPIACMCLLQAAHGIHCGGAACPLMGHIGPWSFSRGGLWSAALMAGYFSQPLPCRLVQPSLLLPKREGGSKARGDAPRCLHASAPAPWPQRLNTTCGCWGWRWLGLGGTEPRCQGACGDTTLHLEEVWSTGCCRKENTRVNLLLCSKQKRATENQSLKLKISRLGCKWSLNCYITMSSF